MKKLITIVLLSVSLSVSADPVNKPEPKKEKIANRHSASNRKGAKLMVIIALFVIVKIKSDHD